ncbi:MAG: damage-inducible protein DinB [marine bacterium B5-7]|nr:MAG: damage-inducible protein DinB [marine bacterium B5-7]
MKTEYLRAMARYNQWMNEKLYRVAARLDDAERKRDQGAFFKSIHGTLDHILLGDRVWMGRFTGELFTPSALDQNLHDNFTELHAERVRFDAFIIDWIHGLDEEAAMADFEYRGIDPPTRRRLKLWFAVTHMFNHQTHHRGQITTLLTQAGEDVGPTDLLWLPGYTEVLD